MDDSAQLYRRLRHLPTAIENTERKLAALYAEARTYKMQDVLQKACFYNEAWDREVEIAKGHAALKGRENSMGVDHG